MIELVSTTRCIQCNICVSVCPTNVFEQVSDAPPAIARQSDCQTCFMCELYCPADALYVAPDTDRVLSITEAQLEEAKLFGSYRDEIGWKKGQSSSASTDQSYYLLRKV